MRLLSGPSSQLRASKVRAEAMRMSLRISAELNEADAADMAQVFTEWVGRFQDVADHLSKATAVVK